jgi:hypothetical protein
VPAPRQNPGAGTVSLETAPVGLVLLRDDRTKRPSQRPAVDQPKALRPTRRSAFVVFDAGRGGCLDTPYKNPRLR